MSQPRDTPSAPAAPLEPGVRTRFAPSPTGFLHLGSARTALFNWAYARRHGGRFVLRVEDTDRERSTAESEAALEEGLRWLGLDWDEGPLRQSERGEHYRAATERLIEGGRAYRCRATKEDIERARAEAGAEGDRNWRFQSPDRDAELGPDCGPHVVRIKMPESGFLGWDDIVFGPSGQDAGELGDAVLVRTDGTPLFHLTGVVDDIEMGITHVIRGADHHSNTPLHIALYRALEAEPPVYAHVPLIVGKSGKKLSKRRDPVSIQQFRADGYLAEALDNWLVRLGWSHGDDEVFSLDDIARLFDLDAVGRSAAQADPTKLQWLNQHWIGALPREQLFERVRPFVEALAGSPLEQSEAVLRTLDLLRERSKTLAEMADLGRWLWCDVEGYDPKAEKKLFTPENAALLRALRAALADTTDWSDPALEAVFERVRSEHGDLGMGKLAQPVRLAVTGRTFSPGIFETLQVLGRERTLARLDAALARCAALQPGAQAADRGL